MFTFFIITATTGIQGILLLAFLWASCVSLWGLCKKKKMPSAAKPSCFAVVICAHNEANVVGKLLQSLAQQNYPKKYYQVFLLADHCQDQTAQVGRLDPSVIVYERLDGERSGKGAVLSWGLQLIKDNYGDKFQHVVVFDADNLVEQEFLAKMNNAFASGSHLIMGNRLALNPYASIISGWYTLYWQTVDILYCKPRSNLGMSAILSGTGFGFSWSLLGELGWQTKTITEDIEFSMQQNLKGVFATYAEEAIFYDEQPTDLATLISQLRRWCTGNYQIFSTYRQVWWEHFRKNPSLKLVDNFIPIGLCVIFGFYLLLSASWLLHNFVQGVPLFGFIDLCWWGGLYVVSVLVSIWSTAKGNFSFVKLMPSILTAGLYCCIFSLVAVSAIFFPTKKWHPIIHKG